MRDIKFVTKEDAQAVLDGMMDVLKTYSYVTIGDLKDLAGLPTTYEDSRYGWAILKDVKIIEEANHFWLALPFPGRITLSS